MAHALTEAAKGLAGSKAQLISGHSGQAILNYAEANDIDCIIIASHRPGVGGAVTPPCSTLPATSSPPAIGEAIQPTLGSHTARVSRSSLPGLKPTW